MSRYFSFAVLLAAIVLLIIMFYKLMVGFFVPLFLAALLVVIFRPLHDWFLGICRGRSQLAAALTTTCVCLVVFVPSALICMLAASEGRGMLQRFSSGAIVSQLTELRQNLHLSIVAIDELRALEKEFNSLAHAPPGDSAGLLAQLARVETAAEQFRIRASIPVPDSEPETEEPGPMSAAIRIFRAVPPELAWTRFVRSLEGIRDAAGRENAAAVPPSGSGPPDAGAAPAAGTRNADPAAEDDSPSDPDSARNDPDPLPVDDAIGISVRMLEGFRNAHCGGKTWAWLKWLSNPTAEELEQYGNQLSVFLREKLPAIGGATTAVLASFVFGLVIMVVALYFFLADGASMLAAIKHLSPLEDADDSRLIAEFSSISRAVVLATLLSALVQGVAAGIGFWACGIEQVFLLTILTTCLALVPFVGAAAVWVPVCVWLYMMEDRMGAAIGLAVYGTAVISMIDNLIKPFVLHGQSNLHPLLALLSVLGGVTAIGPIGILIGPMIVAFLQTTLEILRKELGALDRNPPVLEAAASGALETPVPAGGTLPPAAPAAVPPAKPGFFAGKGKGRKKGK